MTLDTTTGEIVETMTEDAARRLTERIRIAATNYVEAKEKVLALVDEAKAGQAHVALGYKSWTAYLSDVLSDEPLRLARDERRELVTRLADEGMSTRAIAPIVGTTKSSVDRDLRASEELSHAGTVEPDAPKPAPVVRTTTGLDGRERTTVTAGQTRRPQRKPLTDSFFRRLYEVRTATESLHRLIEDDRWAQNAEKVAAAHRNDLLRINDLLQQVIASLPEQESTE